MKKNFFLVCAMLCAYSSFATCVTAKQVSTNITNKTVTFTLTWTGCTTANHLTDAWCFVDFREEGSNSWTRATVSGTTVTIGSNVTTGPGGNKGFYVKGTEGLSATVTAKLGNVSVDKFDWCAFATDFPPQVSSCAAIDVVFKGTPPFEITYISGSTATVDSKNYRLTDLLKSFTDATGSTGTVPPFTPSSNIVGGCDCTGASDTSTFETFTPTGTEPVGTLVCLQDTRSANAALHRYYRVKKMHDNKWWMVQNLAYSGTGTVDFCNKSTWNSGTSTALASVNYSTRGLYGDCRNTGNPVCSGYVYNWAAAIQNPNGHGGPTTSPNPTGCDNNTGNVTLRGLCPEKWHLPAAAEFIALDVAMGGDGLTGVNKNTTIYWLGGTSTLSWEADYIGRCHPDPNNGYMHINSEGTWWSSCADTAHLQWARYMAVIVNPPVAIYPSASIAARNWLFPVRCVKN